MKSPTRTYAASEIYDAVFMPTVGTLASMRSPSGRTCRMRPQMHPDSRPAWHRDKLYIVLSERGRYKVVLLAEREPAEAAGGGTRIAAEAEAGPK